MVVGSSAGDLVKVLPIVLVGLLLLVSGWWDSAFDLRYWAPLTILSMALLLAQLCVGGWQLRGERALTVATVAIWVFALYVLLTAAWSQSAALAWEEAARTSFYAALWTLAVGAGAAGAWRNRLGAGLTVGIAAVAVVTLVGLLFNADGLFLAGRLDSPVGYRNGTAALFAFGFWPLSGFAARRGTASGARAAAFAAAVLVLGLAFLTQSRGVLIGLVLGGVVSLAIGPDRLRRAWLAIAAATAIAVVSGPLLTPYDAFDGGAGTVAGGDIQDAATALLLVCAAAFVASTFLFVFDNGLRSSGIDRRMRVVGVAALAVLALGAGAAGLAKIGSPVGYADEKLKEFNDVEPAAVSGSTRLGTVGGQRSDLWRVAWDQFRDHPLAGAGAGSYQFAYYRDRQTDRNLSDTHSLPLRLLADTGLIGAALFAIWLVAVAIAIARRAREAIEPDRIWVAGLAAAGVTLLAQCLVDWLWLLPGLLGLAVLALGLAAGRERVDRVAVPRGWSPGRVAVGAALAAALVGVTFLYLSDLYIRKARVDALHSPRAELDSARLAAWFDPVAVTPLYLQASALESEGNRAGAKKALRDALDREPENFVTLALLGDFEVRGGNRVAARKYYRRALSLNPLDSGLRKLSEGAE
jgi:tetratricopeptide (TPR) repeat protein